MRYTLVLKNTFVISCLLGMVWWFHLQNRAASHSKQQSKPQEYMAQLNITNFSEAGKPKEKLQAEYWAFVPNNASSELNSPHITIYKINGDVWHLSAEKAKAWHLTLSDKITKLDMINQVVIERTAENNAIPTKISTETLHYFPNKEMLTSDDYVYMRQPGLLISGHGMSGYLGKNLIELHNNIKTVYSPNAN